MRNSRLEVIEQYTSQILFSVHNLILFITAILCKINTKKSVSIKQTKRIVYVAIQVCKNAW